MKNEKKESLKFKWRGFSAPAGRFKRAVCRGENAMSYLRFMKKKGAKKWEGCYNISTEGAKKRRAAPKKNEWFSDQKGCWIWPLFSSLLRWSLRVLRTAFLMGVGRKLRAEWTISIASSSRRATSWRMKSLPRTGIDRLQNEETDGFGRPFFWCAGNCRKWVNPEFAWNMLFIAFLEIMFMQSSWQKDNEIKRRIVNLISLVKQRKNEK